MLLVLAFGLYTAVWGLDERHGSQSSVSLDETVYINDALRERDTDAVRDEDARVGGMHETEDVRGTRLGPADATVAELIAAIPDAYAHCHTVHIDLGANIGVHERFLFEGSKYPDSKFATARFTELFGAPEERARPSTDTGLCALGVEANPSQATRLGMVADCLQSQGHTVNFIVPAAVTTKSGTVTLHMEGRADGPTHAWGSTISSGIKSAGEELFLGSDVTIPTLDLVALVHALKGKRLIVKMDIEGEENSVLPQLEAAGVLCDGSIEEINADFHQLDYIYEQYGKESVIALQQRMEKQTYECANADAKKTKFSALDDESYTTDNDNDLCGKSLEEQYGKRIEELHIDDKHSYH